MSGILIDWDSCLNDFDGALCTSLNEKFGTSYTTEDMTYWDFLRGGMPKEHVAYLWKTLFRDVDWTLALPPKPGAVLGYNRLVDAGYEVHVVTARFKYMRPWLIEWLQTNGFLAPKAVATFPKKAVYAWRNGIKLAIEDAPHNANDLWKTGVTVYLVDAPWNREVVQMPTLRRVPSVWVAAERILGGYDDAEG